MTNNSELVSLTPALVSEALFNIHKNKSRFDLIEQKGENEIISVLMNQLPQSDDDREGWVNSLSLAVIGYRRGLQSDFTSPEEQQAKITESLQTQLGDDFIRWGDTWKKRPMKGQFGRTIARFKDYVDQFENGGQSFPWLKVMGGVVICLARIDLKDIENYEKA